MASVVEIEDEVGIEMIKSYFESVPLEFFEGAGLLLVVSLFIFVAFRGVKNGLRYTMGVAFLEYSALIYSSTVFFRNTQAERKYDFQPFWTYAAIMDGKDQFVNEAIMNVVAFIPIGFLLGCIFRSMSWWLALVIGSLLSVGIEVLQFVFMKGFSEFDDVMHNTIGCLIGYGLFSFARYGYERIGKRCMAFSKLYICASKRPTDG